MNKQSFGKYELTSRRSFMASVAAVVVTFLLAVLITGCRGGKGNASDGGPGKTDKKDGASDPLMSLGGHFDVTGGEMTERNSKGELVWKMHSPQAGLDFSQKVAAIHSVDGTLYAGGQPSIHVEAPEATIDSDKKILHLARGVQVRSLTEPESFSADEVVWQWQQTNGLEATGHVQFHRGAAVVTAGRMIADVTLRTARLLDGPVAVAPARGV